MDLTGGFQIDVPKLTVPFGIEIATLLEIFENEHLEKITFGYYTASVTCLGGLECRLGFHFRRPKKLLNELEFFDNQFSDDIDKSFNKFQAHFEQEFGLPTASNIAVDRYPPHKTMPHHEWTIGCYKISHSVINRFGYEEHMRVFRDVAT